MEPKTSNKKTLTKGKAKSNGIDELPKNFNMEVDKDFHADMDALKTKYGIKQTAAVIRMLMRNDLRGN